MASSLPTRARHVMERAKVLRAFPLTLISIFLRLRDRDEEEEEGRENMNYQGPK